MTQHHTARNYEQTPLNVYWEMTQACALACRHCRAEAMPAPHPNELSLGEGKALLAQITEFGQPLPQLILTGGDPLLRPDLFELIDEAHRLGIGVSITPAATPALTRDLLVRLIEHGVEGLGLSLDGSTAERHDSIRGVLGTFDRTMQAISWATELKIPLQVNTLCAAETASDMPALFELLRPYGVTRWSLFFLISVGRGRVLEALAPEAAEQLMAWIYETSRRAPFTVATTEAPSYRRVAIERMREDGPSPASRSRRAAWAAASASATGMALSSYLAPATSAPLDSCLWPRATCVKTSWPRSIAIPRSLSACTTRASSKGTAAYANSVPSAAVPAPEPTPPPAIR